MDIKNKKQKLITYLCFLIYADLFILKYGLIE